MDKWPGTEWPGTEVASGNTAEQWPGQEWPGQEVSAQQPPQPQQPKRSVGVFEAMQDDFNTGANKLARGATAIAGLPFLAVDAAANALTGKETGASEWWANNVFGRYQGFIDAAEQKARETQRSIPAQVGGAVGQLATMAPELILGNKLQQGMNVATGTKPLAEMLVRGFAGAQPMAGRAGVERYADAKQAGADDLSAINAGLGTYANMAGQGIAPMGAAGGIGKRMVTGAAVNPVMGAAGRVMENAVNAPSGIKALQQDVVSPEQAIIDSILGAGMHTALGSRAERVQKPGDIAADRAAYDKATAERQQFVAEGWKEFGPLLESNGIKPEDPRAERAIAALLKNRAEKANAEAAKAEDAVAPSPEEQSISAGKQLPDVIAVDSNGRADVGDVGIKAGAMSAEGTKAQVEKQARQSFDLAARRQSQADADLANRGEVGPDYQGGGAAAHGGEFDSGIRKVILLDGEMPVTLMDSDGKKATVAVEHNGKEILVEVDLKRLSEHDIPANQRMAQDFGPSDSPTKYGKLGRSYEPPTGVGVETMAGEKMPRRSTDRIAGDEIGGRTTAYDPTPLDGGRVEGDVLPPDAGTSVVPGQAREGETISGTATRPTAGVHPTGQKQLGEPRKLLEERARFAADEQGRMNDRENRQDIPGEGRPGAKPTEPQKAAEKPSDTQTPPEPQKPNSESRREPEQPLMGRESGDPFAETPKQVELEWKKDGSVWRYGEGTVERRGGHSWFAKGSPDEVAAGFTTAAEAQRYAEAAVRERMRERGESIAPTVEQRAKDPETMGELKRMADNAGWQEEGGKLLRDTEGNANGRTKWIPNEPWFRSGMGEANVKEAVARLENGKPLTNKHREIVRSMLDWIDDNHAATAKAERAEVLDAADLSNTPGHMADISLAEKAALLYPDAFEELAMRHADSSHDEFMADVRRLIDGGTVQHTAEAPAGKRTGVEDHRSGETVSKQADRANEKDARPGQASGEVGSELDGKRITIDGERVDAGDYMRMLDDRTNAMKKLLDCLGS